MTIIILLIQKFEELRTSDLAIRDSKQEEVANILDLVNQDSSSEQAADILDPMNQDSSLEQVVDISDPVNQGNTMVVELVGLWFHYKHKQKEFQMVLLELEGLVVDSKLVVSMA